MAITIDKESLLSAIKSGSVSCGYTDKDTGERIEFMVANDEEAAENEKVDAIAAKLESGENLTSEFLKDAANILREAEKDRTMWRGRMKYVLHQREERKKVARPTKVDSFFCIAKDGEDGKPRFFGLTEYEGPGCPGIDVPCWEVLPLLDCVAIRKHKKDAVELMNRKDWRGNWENVTQKDRLANARVVEVAIFMKECDK